ncbi:Putative uncharacterized protein [Moritella viscosa]|nr:Putative uncharacterized protein [Moritella viscosa]
MGDICSYFKFVSIERKDILENGMIRFTPVGEFNDPFELEPVITPLSRKYIEHCLGLTDIERSQLEFRDEDYEYSSIRFSRISEYKYKYKDNVSKYGVLSLSSNTDINNMIDVSIKENKDPRRNILMWSHYASSHNGFVIEFSKDFIQGVEIKDVDYSDGRDFLTFEDIDENKFDHVFYKKSDEWKYEQEHRCVMPLNKATRVDNGIYHLFSFDKSKVSSITFGCEVSDESKKDIIELIESDSKFGRVNFYHTRLDDFEYILDIYYDDGRISNNPDSPFAIKRIPSQIKFEQGI